MKQDVNRTDAVTAGLTSAEARLDGLETEFGENRIGLLCIAFVTPQNVINCHYRTQGTRELPREFLNCLAIRYPLSTIRHQPFQLQRRPREGPGPWSRRRRRSRRWRAISAAGVQIVRTIRCAAPDDHFAAGPDGSLIETGARRVCGSRSGPSVRAGIVSATGVRNGHIIR